MEIKRSALEDSSNEMSDDERKKDRSDSNHSKVKSSTASVKKNPLQNTAKLGKCCIIYEIDYCTLHTLFNNSTENYLRIHLYSVINSRMKFYLYLVEKQISFYILSYSIYFKKNYFAFVENISARQLIHT